MRFKLFGSFKKVLDELRSFSTLDVSELCYVLILQVLSSNSAYVFPMGPARVHVRIMEVKKERGYMIYVDPEKPMDQVGQCVLRSLQYLEHKGAINPLTLS